MVGKSTIVKNQLIMVVETPTMVENFTIVRQIPPISNTVNAVGSQMFLHQNVKIRLKYDQIIGKM